MIKKLDKCIWMGYTTTTPQVMEITMTNKKLTKKQKQQMLLDAIMIAEGAQEPTPQMSYIQAWQYLVDTGEVWKLQGWFGRAAFRMISEGTIDPAPIEEEPQDNGDEQ